MKPEKKIELLLFMKSFFDYLLNNYRGNCIIECLPSAIENFVHEKLGKEEKEFLGLFNDLDPDLCIYKALSKNVIKEIEKYS